MTRSCFYLRPAHCESSSFWDRELAPSLTGSVFRRSRVLLARSFSLSCTGPTAKRKSVCCNHVVGFTHTYAAWLFRREREFRKVASHRFPLQSSCSSSFVQSWTPFMHPSKPRLTLSPLRWFVSLHHHRSHLASPPPRAFVGQLLHAATCSCRRVLRLWRRSVPALFWLPRSRLLLASLSRNDARFRRHLWHGRRMMTASEQIWPYHKHFCGARPLRPPSPGRLSRKMSPTACEGPR